MYLFLLIFPSMHLRAATKLPAAAAARHRFLQAPSGVHDRDGLPPSPHAPHCSAPSRCCPRPQRPLPHAQGALLRPAGRTHGTACIGKVFFQGFPISTATVLYTEGPIDRRSQTGKSSPKDQSFQNVLILVSL